MTVEQLAEKWVDEWGICCRAENMNANQFAKQAYIAGYNEAQNTITQCNRSALSGVKWHKVADGNYPLCEKGYYTVNVLTNDGDIAYYDFNGGCWIAEPSSVEIDPPIAWCEIPKYTEE